MKTPEDSHGAAYLATIPQRQGHVKPPPITTTCAATFPLQAPWGTPSQRALNRCAPSYKFRRRFETRGITGKAPGALNSGRPRRTCGARQIGTRAEIRRRFLMMLGT